MDLFKHQNAFYQCCQSVPNKRSAAIQETDGSASVPEPPRLGDTASLFDDINLDSVLNFSSSQMLTQNASQSWKQKTDYLKSSQQKRKLERLTNNPDILKSTAKFQTPTLPVPPSRVLPQKQRVDIDDTNTDNGDQPVGISSRLDTQPKPKHLDLQDNPYFVNKGAKIGKLRSVEEIPDPFRQVFSFPFFNFVQSKVFDEVFYTNNPIVVCAPTGSGKTVVFELAIIRLLVAHKQFKVVYMAPVKSLCSERYNDWKTKFEVFGLKCRELTGDTELDDYYELYQVNIVLTTPEKWDSMTRRWRDNQSWVKNVFLFLIDEIHVLNDKCRGATMEAVISRMKTIRSAVCTANIGLPDLRFIAVSATIPNTEDIAEWLGDGKTKASHYRMDESFRPVRLRRVVLGFPYHDRMTEFRFDISLSYKLSSIINTYSEMKPTLVFCSTRKSTQQTADVLAKDARFIYNNQHKQKLNKYSNLMKDSKLRDFIAAGIGFHHAGVDLQDRKYVEELFSNGELPVLIATSTLAMGVNFPAHLVIVKSTVYYNMGETTEYSDTQVLQMIGRAGRPQFDTTATAVIMTKSSLKGKYESLLNGTQMIESSLHKNLIEHLNAEIVLNTISDLSVAIDWIRHTFLYIRVMKNPRHYGLPCGLSKEEVEGRLQELCLKNLNLLGKYDLIHMDDEIFDITPTDIGRLMARYCIAFDTTKKFLEIKEDVNLSDMLDHFSSCIEYTDIQLRTNEKKTLNTLNKDKNRLTISSSSVHSKSRWDTFSSDVQPSEASVSTSCQLLHQHANETHSRPSQHSRWLNIPQRYPMKGKIKTREMKVNCLIQAQLGCLQYQDFPLQQDTTRIFRIGQRVSKFLMELMWNRSNYKSLLSAIQLCRCFKCKIWNDSKYVCKQIDGIGQTLSNALVNAGITSFRKVEATNPRELELVVNRHPPFGNTLKESAAGLPKYELSVEQVAGYAKNRAEILISLSMANREYVDKVKNTAGPTHLCLLLIADEDNRIVYKTRISDSILLQGNGYHKKLDVYCAAAGPALYINLISQDWVGLDVQNVYTPVYTGAEVKNKTSSTESSRFFSKKSGTLNPPSVKKNGEKSDESYCKHKCINKLVCGHDCCKSAGMNSLNKNENDQQKKIDARVPWTPRKPPDLKKLMGFAANNSSSNCQPKIGDSSQSQIIDLTDDSGGNFASSKLNRDHMKDTTNDNWTELNIYQKHREELTEYPEDPSLDQQTDKIDGVLKDGFDDSFEDYAAYGNFDLPYELSTKPEVCDDLHHSSCSLSNENQYMNAMSPCLPSMYVDDALQSNGMDNLVNYRSTQKWDDESFCPALFNRKDIENNYTDTFQGCDTFGCSMPQNDTLHSKGTVNLVNYGSPQKGDDVPLFPALFNRKSIEKNYTDTFQGCDTFGPSKPQNDTLYSERKVNSVNYGSPIKGNDVPLSPALFSGRGIEKNYTDTFQGCNTFGPSNPKKTMMERNSPKTLGRVIAWVSSTPSHPQHQEKSPVGRFSCFSASDDNTYQKDSSNDIFCSIFDGIF